MENKRKGRVQRTKEVVRCSLKENASDTNILSARWRKKDDERERERERGRKTERDRGRSEKARAFMIRQLQSSKFRNKADFHDGIMLGCNMCIGSLWARLS
jgi:hypothetical protein